MNYGRTALSAHRDIWNVRAPRMERNDLLRACGSLLSDSKARCYCGSLTWTSFQPSLKHPGHHKPLLVTMGMLLFVLFWCKDSIPRGSCLEENGPSSLLLLLVLHLEGRDIYLLHEWKRIWHHQSHQRSSSQSRKKMALVIFLVSQLFQTCSQSMDKACCLCSGLCMVSNPASSFLSLSIL